MKKPKNPEIKYIEEDTEKRIKRAEYIEKLSREICVKVYGLNPDDLVCKQIPAHINNMDKFPLGWIVPDERHFFPCWWLFKSEVEIILKCIEENPQ